MTKMLWGSLVPDRIAESAETRGSDKLLRDFSRDETLCVAGMMVGAGDLLLHSPEGTWGEFARSFRSTLTRLIGQHNGTLAELSDDRFLVVFPKAKQLVEKPVGSGFAFLTDLDRESHELFADLAHRLYHHPITADGKPRAYGFAIGVDMGEVEWSLHEDLLVISGAPVTWARRCMSGDAESIIVNNALRWRMAESALEPASAVALYAHHILFREVVVVADGLSFRAYRLARRK